MLNAMLPLCLLATPLLVAAALAGYPPPDVTPPPKQEWIDAYNAVKAQGKIPGLAPSTVVNGSITYPVGVQPCSFSTTYCRAADGSDLYDAPTGIVGLSFDDGPVAASTVLYNFLTSVQAHATHFMIGSRILEYPQSLQLAVKNGDHIGVHTWSHPQLSTLTDFQILGELGWTMQVISDLTGFVPSFWRPPFGDVDDRVRAIAREVFQLRTAMWNRDASDWCLKDGGGSGCPSGRGPGNDAGLDAELQNLYSGPKTPGLVILEHEITNRSIGGFARNYPFMLSKGWTPRTFADAFSLPWYQNALNSTAPISRGATLVTSFLNSTSNTSSSVSSATSSTSTLRLAPTSMSSFSAAPTVPPTPAATTTVASTPARSSSSGRLQIALLPFAATLLVATRGSILSW